MRNLTKGIGLILLFLTTVLVSCTSRHGEPEVNITSSIGPADGLDLKLVGAILQEGNIKDAEGLEKEINKEGGINNLHDLDKMKVATINGTASSQFLDDNDIKYINYDSPTEALDAINRGELDAFVYDEPILQYYTGMDKYSNLIISDKKFMEQTYGFVLPKDSNLDSTINPILLKVIRSDEWDLLLNKYNLK